MKLCPICEAEYSDDVQHCVRDGEPLVQLRARGYSLVGKTLSNRYRLVEVIGEGGMGTVYKGIQEPAERPVAVKVLHAELANEKEAIRRFFNEARVVSRLRHPNTVTLYDFGQSESGELFIAMELMTGISLTNLIGQRCLTLPEILEILDQVGQSLEEAHQLGIIHRDLKPDNVFIDRVGSRHIVKVLDFGIAKVPDSREHLTRTGMVFGTPAYMSPEQAQGYDLDHRSDIYTLGVVLYQALAGVPPFTADAPMQVALKQVIETPRSIDDVSLYSPLPTGLSTLIMDMLEKDPANRPQTITEVRERLLNAAKQLPGLAVELNPARVEVPVATGSADTLPAAWSWTARRPPEPETIPTAASTEPIRAFGGETFEEERSQTIPHEESTALIPVYQGEMTTPDGDVLSVDFTYRRQIRLGAIAGILLVALAVLLVVLTQRTVPSTSTESMVGTLPVSEDSAISMGQRERLGEADPYRFLPSLPAIRTAFQAAQAVIRRIQLVTIRIETEPAGATVRLSASGHTLGSTPVVLTLARSERPVQLDICLPGFHDERVAIVADTPQERRISLVALENLPGSTIPPRRYDPARRGTPRRSSESGPGATRGTIQGEVDSSEIDAGEVRPVLLPPVTLPINDD